MALTNSGREFFAIALSFGWMTGSCSAPAISLTMSRSCAAAFLMAFIGSSVLESRVAFAVLSRSASHPGTASRVMLLDTGSLLPKIFFMKLCMCIPGM